MERGTSDKKSREKGRPLPCHWSGFQEFKEGSASTTWSAMGKRLSRPSRLNKGRPQKGGGQEGMYRRTRCRIEQGKFGGCNGPLDLEPC